MPGKTRTPIKDASVNLGFEAKRWHVTDKLRNNMDAADYWHLVLGLIFLKYMPNILEEHRGKRLAGEWNYEGANPEDQDAYKAKNVLWVPQEVRWPHLQAKPKQSIIGKTVDDAMVAIERDNPRLKCVLPKDYVCPGLDKHRLGELIDLIATAFTLTIQPMLDRIHSNFHQSRTLSTLRDTLQPKLLSGEFFSVEATT